MKNRSLFKLISILLVPVFLLAAFSACNKKTDDESKPEITGKDAVWHSVTVLVPDGMNFIGGSAVNNANDENALWIESANDKLAYFYITLTTEDSAKSSVQSIKELNAGEDVRFETGSIEWRGVKYKYAGVSDNFVVYAAINGRTVFATGSRFTCDSPEALAVLGSIRIAD